MFSYYEEVNVERSEFYVKLDFHKLDTDDYEGVISDFTAAIKINSDNNMFFTASDLKELKNLEP